ncbi:patatin-like phospholipase family protein [Aggregatibacter actinomycetemcomitans]|nr:patatin-like phospholipase family protein [Aggregatibacter actinomycetemcomitans]
MKVGLVFEGGAMRGMFTAGVLDVFLDEQIHIDGITSVSAGALFGVNFPSKQRGRVLRYNKKYLNDKRYMGFHSLFTMGNIVNKDCAFYQLPFELDIFDQDEFARAGIDFSCFRGVGIYRQRGASDKSLSVSHHKKSTGNRPHFMV